MKGMDLYIKVTSGKRAGDIFKLQPSITLGRSKADIHLKDSKASSIHAKIVEENGDLYYLDMNSTNGTLVSGAPVKKVKLAPGVVITVGTTNLEIVSEFDIKKTQEVNLSEWREALYNLTQKLKTDQALVEVSAFERCISVEIKSGVQAGTGWILGYGPRKLGPGSSDLCILDDTLDEYCLEISQSEEGHVIIESIGETPFLVDGKKRITEILKNRLKIQVGSTILELGFVE